MFRVAAPEFFSYLWIGVLPEAGEICRDRQRALGRGQEVGYHWHPAGRHRRCFSPAKQGLQLGSQHRAVVGSVIQHHLLASGNGQGFRSQFIQLLLLWIIEQAVQGGYQI